MSEYGLRVKDAAGNVLLDSDDLTFRVRYHGVVSSGSSGSVNLPDISGKSVELLSIPLTEYALAHEVSRNGNTISWTAKTSGSGSYYFPSSDSIIVVILTD
jgi:hypothetical protein